MSEIRKFFEIILTLNTNNMTGELLNSMISLGATIFRLNGSFLGPEGVRKVAGNIREKCAHNVKIILDLPGYKPRFTYLEDVVRYTENVAFKIKKECINYSDLIEKLENQDVLRINDGMVKLKIIDLQGDAIIFEPDRSGVLRKGKGFYIEKRGFRPSDHCLSRIDEELIETAKQNGIDYVGLSFVHGLDDIFFVQEKLAGSRLRIIPKIEARESVRHDNLRAILKESDTVIVDRGDMSGEMGISNIWKLQRKILKMARLQDCRVIMATQLFPQMVNRPLPSIPEIDSFYDLIDLGISGIQLSEETCVGENGLHILRLIKESVSRMDEEIKCPDRGPGEVVWIMGRSSSGKTTLAEALVRKLDRAGFPVVHIDGDEIRHLFGEALSFEREDRLRVVKAIVYLAEKASKKGDCVVVSALTAYEDARQYVRDHLSRLSMVYLDCPIEECIKRDTNGIYAKAIQGTVDTVVGFNSAYLAPQETDLTVDTREHGLEESVEQVTEFLIRNKKIAF